MIKINRVYQLESLETSLINDYSIVFFGDVIDERTAHSTSVIDASQCIKKIKIKWLNDIKKFMVNDSETSFDDFKKICLTTPVEGKVLIEATSLDFPEITYILNEFKARGIGIDIVYIEPKDYRKQETASPDEINFDLSTNQKTFSSLPFFGVSNLEPKAVLVAPLGFEPMRLGQLLNTDESRDYSVINALIAIPAYKAGWENRSIKSNLRHFRKNSDIDLLLYPSSNPYEIYKRIEDLWNAYNRIILAPLGTKPSTIALAIFLVNEFPNNARKKNIFAVYDFPSKKKSRTQGIDKIHLFKTCT